MKNIISYAVLLMPLVGTGCASSETPGASAESEGGEDPGALEGAKASVDETHEDFKEEVKPAAEFVDEKTQAVIDEGKKLVGAGDDTASPAAGGDAAATAPAAAAPDPAAAPAAAAPGPVAAPDAAAQ